MRQHITRPVERIAVPMIARGPADGNVSLALVVDFRKCERRLRGPQGKRLLDDNFLRIALQLHGAINEVVIDIGVGPF